MKIHTHVRGKSDTDYNLDKKYLDNIHYNLKHLRETPNQSGDSTKDVRSYHMKSIFISLFYFIIEFFYKKQSVRKFRTIQLNNNNNNENFEEVFISFLIKIIKLKI